jgi:hypothetical protein
MAHRAAHTSLSRTHRAVGWRHAYGRRDEALAAIEEAITAYRDLARARPRMFGSVLSRSLDHMAGLLSALDRNAEPEAALTEAESVRRDDVTASPV